MIKRKQTNRIIFHHSLTNGGNVDTIRRWHIHMNGWLDIGYHAIILPDGTIEKGRDIKLIGAHAKGKNSDSIGVCLIGDFRECEPTVDQIESSLRYYHEACRYYSKNLKIEFHRNQILPNACPGKRLDRKDFLEIVYRGRI